MIRQKIEPDLALQPYIDSYWTVKTANPKPFTYHKIPDSFTDILIILGNDFKTDTNFTLKNEHTYLAGIKTHSVQINRQSNTKIIGISFKPSAFSSFYSFETLSNLTNKIVELNNRFVPPFGQLKDHTKNSLNSFF